MKGKFLVFAALLSIIFSFCMITACAPQEDENKFTITVQKAENGIIALEPNDDNFKFTPGSKVIVVIRANPGYIIDSYKIGNENAELDERGRYTLTVRGDTTISASFKSLEGTACTLDTYKTGNGSVIVTPQKDEYVYNDKITVEVAANQGWYLDDFSVSSDPIAALIDGKYTFKIKGNTSIDVKFVERPELQFEDSYYRTWYRIKDGTIIDQTKENMITFGIDNTVSIMGYGDYKYLSGDADEGYTVTDDVEEIFIKILPGDVLVCETDREGAVFFTTLLTGLTSTGNVPSARQHLYDNGTGELENEMWRFKADSMVTNAGFSPKPVIGFCYLDSGEFWAYINNNWINGKFDSENNLTVYDYKGSLLGTLQLDKEEGLQ